MDDVMKRLLRVLCSNLRKGDIITLEFAKALEVKLGNAGGVQVSYDGTELPAPGQDGQVKTLVFPPAAN